MKTTISPLWHSLHTALCLATVWLCAGCGPSAQEQAANAAAAERERVGRECDAAEKELTSLADGLTTALAPLTFSEATRLLRQCEQIGSDIRPDSLNTSSEKRMEMLERQRANFKRKLLAAAQKRTMPLFADKDSLLEAPKTYPVFLEGGSTLVFEVQAETQATVKVYNADRDQLLKTCTARPTATDSIAIRFPAIYLVEVAPNGRQYMNVDICVRPGSENAMKTPRAIAQTDEACAKTALRARQIKGISMKDAFNEPQKLTLRSNLKALFSGSSVSLVAIQVPSGATDIMYQMRISTNETAGDGENGFHERLETSYKKVKFMGLPIYESHAGSGLIATLLGLDTPYREEEAYLNMYVFYDAATARRFQNGTKPSQLKYNLDYSKMGTQSCNGHIPTRGSKTVYLAFENERMRYSNYVWLQAVTSSPTTEYYRTIYKLK